MLEKLELRRDGKKMAIIRLHELPLPLVHHPVMAMTEQDQVWQIGRATFDPMHQVVP